MHGADFLASMRAAVDGKVLNGNSYKRDWIEALWPAWAAWCDAGVFDAPLDARVERLTTSAMRAKVKKVIWRSPICTTTACRSSATSPAIASGKARAIAARAVARSRASAASKDARQSSSATSTETR